MSGLEIFVVIECVAAIILLMNALTFAGSVRRRKKNARETRYVLYDPDGLYAPITKAQLAEIDRAAALGCAQGCAAAQERNAENLQYAPNARKPL